MVRDGDLVSFFPVWTSTLLSVFQALLTEDSGLSAVCDLGASLSIKA